MIIGGFRANGFLSISSILLQGLAFPGRSCTLFIQLHDLGSPLGQYICFLLRQPGSPCNFVCQELHNSPCDEPCMVDHFSNSHLLLILHLLLGMSPRLMSLLIVCLVSRCHCSTFSTRCIAMPAPCLIPTFFSKV